VFVVCLISKKKRDRSQGKKTRTQLE